MHSTATGNIHYYIWHRSSRMSFMDATNKQDFGEISIKSPSKEAPTFKFGEWQEITNYRRVLHDMLYAHCLARHLI